MALDDLSARVGELRRLTFMYCDIVGSTELSGRLEPETYRELMRGYRDASRDAIESRFGGHIVRIKGDGALAIFGYPAAHENDAERAVRAGLALVQAVHGLPSPPGSDGPLDLRVGIHHGPVYLDFDEDDIYGLAANVGARLETLADPGAVVVSDEVRELVEDCFELEACEPQMVKGVTEPLRAYRIIGERAAAALQPAAPLIEREDELERLRRAWASVAAGDTDRTTGLLIRGDAGVGKSRLISALDDEVCRGGACFLALHGSPFHVDAGLHPVRRMVETRCGIRDDMAPPERLARLRQELADLELAPAEMIPRLGPVLGIDPGAGYEPATTEGRLLEEQVARASLDYIVASTRGRPAILVAEDLHWFDDASRELLAELMRRGPGNLLIVATSRHPEPGQWETIELCPLTLAGRLELIDALEGGLPEEDRLALASRSDGVPLYLEELVRAGASASLIDSTTPVPGSVPAVLYEPLVARLYATPDAIPVAATAAATGQEADRSFLAEVMSVRPSDLEPVLRDLVDVQVMQPVPGRRARFQFRHELLREVAYELQPPSWRRKVHSRLGDLLSRGEVSDWRVLASHFELAERFREAAKAYENTAEGARRRGALTEACIHLTRAAELVEKVGEDEGRDNLEVGIRLRRGFLTMLAEGVADTDASADFDRCLELAASDPRGGDMVSALAALWARDLSLGALQGARQISETLYAGLDERTEYLRTEVLAGFGMLDWFEGSFESALETLSGCAHDLARIEREHESETFWFTTGYPTLHMKAHLAIAQFMTGDVAGADRPLEESIAAGESMEFPRGPWAANYARWLGSWMWMEARRFDRAGDALADLHASSARHGFDSWELVAATQDSALDGLRAIQSTPSAPGELADQADILGAFIELWLGLGLKVLLPFSITTHGALLAAAGDVEGASARYHDSLALAADTGMRFYDAETVRRIAHLARDHDHKISELRTALDLARSQKARLFELRIERDLEDARMRAVTPR